MASSSLSAFESLPLDISLEIFSYAYPIGLIRLCSTNKALRETLLSPTKTYLWRQARRNAAVPEPPEDMSELCWARTLFGGNCCQICKNRTCYRINFVLAKRICSVCLSEKSTDDIRRVPLPAFLFCGPSIAPLSLKQMITTSSGWSKHLFWIPDVQTVATKLLDLSGGLSEFYVISVKSEKEDMSEEYTTYVEERKRFVASAEEHALKCAKMIPSGVLTLSNERSMEAWQNYHGRQSTMPNKD